jgi:DNA-binding transcriptional MerR regulator
MRGGHEARKIKVEASQHELGQSLAPLSVREAVHRTCAGNRLTKAEGSRTVTVPMWGLPCPTGGARDGEGDDRRCGVSDERESVRSRRRCAPLSAVARRACIRTPVTKLTIGEAAALLHVSPSTIRSWEQRLDYPRPVRSASGTRLYEEAEIALLGEARARGLSISSAIRQIRHETGAHEALLRDALSELDLDAGDSLLEAAIATRGVGRAFDETVLAAVEQLAVIDDDGSVSALAIEWAKDRACWGCRQVASQVLHTVVIIDGSPEGSVTRVARCILQLQLTLRSGRTHVLLGAARCDYRDIVRQLNAHAIVFVGPPPPASLGDPMISTLVAGFRTEEKLLHHGVETLSSQPRLAAEKLLSARPIGEPRGFSLDSAHGVCANCLREPIDPKRRGG